ncbi:hypothetical protein J6590_104476 [Homalodisca vitripennis]|nr:hypothetical protein J6590_104476 [Homalodisca vitripennis]
MTLKSGSTSLLTDLNKSLSTVPKAANSHLPLVLTPAFVTGNSHGKREESDTVEVVKSAGSVLARINTVCRPVAGYFV